MIKQEDLNIEEMHIKTMGHIYEICYLQKRNNKISTQLLDKDHYFNLYTGEVFECNHINNRSESKFQVGQSLKRLRDYINTNVIDVSCCKWITLTYKDNMQDTNKLYLDFKRFITRLKRYYKN